MNTTSSTSRPALKGSLKPQQLTGYLAGVLGTAALVGAPQAEAAVTAVTFDFGPTFNFSDGHGLFGTTPSFGELTGRVNNGYLNLGSGSLSYGSVYHNGSGGASYGRATLFSNGTVIGGGGNGPSGKGFFYHGGASWYSFPSSFSNQNIGFRTNTGNWGWANVDWDNTNKALIFNSAYVESVAGNTITVGVVGAVPEPSRALLALAGLGGLALRRRRKQAA